MSFAHIDATWRERVPTAPALSKYRVRQFVTHEPDKSAVRLTMLVSDGEKYCRADESIALDHAIDPKAVEAAFDRMEARMAEHAEATFKHFYPEGEHTL